MSIGASKPAIGLCRGRGLASWAIRRQTWTGYSHAFLRRWDGRIIEAWFGDGVRVKWLDDWRGVDLYDVPGATTERWDDVFNFAEQQVGEKYDNFGVLRFLSRPNRRAGDNGRWFCSELVAEAFKSAGLPLLHRVPSARVSPGMLSYSPMLRPIPTAGRALL